MFFYTPENWLYADKKGKFKEYQNNFHFYTTSEPLKTYRLITLINTHSPKYPSKEPNFKPNENIKFGKWIIKINLSNKESPSFSIKHSKEEISIKYEGEETTLPILSSTKLRGIHLYLSVPIYFNDIHS